MKKISLVLVLVAMAAAPAWAGTKNNPGGALKKTGAAPIGLKLQGGTTVSARSRQEWIHVANTVISDHRPGNDPTSHGFVYLADKPPPVVLNPVTRPTQSTSSGRPFGHPAHHTTSSPNGGVTVTVRKVRPNDVVGGW